MKPCIAVTFLFILLAHFTKFNPAIATKVDFWDRINTTEIDNASSFSFLCQDQMVKVGSKIYHLDRLRSSLKSPYFEKLFTSDDFKQKNNRILEIQPLNGEVFSAVVDLIHGKKLSDVLNKENYVLLLEAMDHLGMEIDLANFRSFIDHNLTAYSLLDAKIFQLYNFIRKKPQFKYLLENVFERFANDLTTLQNHTLFLSLPLDHLISTIDRVEYADDKKMYEIIQMCTGWLCHDMENRLFQMWNIVGFIESHFSKELNADIGKHFPKCIVDEHSKRKIISRCLFALLAGKNLDELKPDENLKSLSPMDPKIVKFYNSYRKNSTLMYLLDGVFDYFAKNLPTLQNHKMFLSLPSHHLIEIIKNIQETSNEIRYQIIQMFTEWLCHDMENRLPHLANLVDAAKSLFHFSTKTNTNVGNSLHRFHFDENSKRKIISRCLWALLTKGGQLSSEIPADDKSNDCTDDGNYSEDKEEKRYHGREYMRIVHGNNEIAKLKNFLKNGEFYDITVLVEEKAYKLHRVILELKCGYFKDCFRAEYSEAVAQCHGKPTCPSKDKEYLLNDQANSSTFDAVIDYIYFGDFKNWTERDIIISIFTTVNILEIQDRRLLENCKTKLMDLTQEAVNPQDIVRILKATYGKAEHDDLYLPNLCKHMTVKWPEIYNVSHFCSISWTMMKDMLKSHHFNLANLDPQKILDICSKWISHDVENRYQYLPEIARIINPMCVVDSDKYTSKVAAELNDFSQQFVKDKLWEILSSLPYNIQTAVSSANMFKKLNEIPAFIARQEGKKTIDLFNVDLDLLETVNVSSSDRLRYFFRGVFSKATLIGENLFVLSDLHEPDTFLVYNLALKKSFALRFDFDITDDYNLLNCNNEVYGYSRCGRLVKYLMQLNRWIVIWEPVWSNEDSFRFTSNGKTLYRTCQNCTRNYIIEAYNFEENSWYPVPNLPIIDIYVGSLYHLSVVNDLDFAVSSYAEIILLRRDSMTWSGYRLPDGLRGFFSYVVQLEDRIFFVNDHSIARFFPSNGSFEFKEGLLEKYKDSEYGFINAIHRIVRTDQL